jgi:hypothetical protein
MLIEWSLGMSDALAVKRRVISKANRNRSGPHLQQKKEKEKRHRRTHE